MSKALQIAVLSYRDVLHEWRMTLCVMFAVAAIATPLLLFFGLRSGVMDTLQKRLLGNPATMELQSVNEKRLDRAWFEELAQDPKVSFVIPRTRRLSASAEFSVRDAPKPVRKTLDLYPTGAGDPLLAHYGTEAPSPDECVLTSEAARRLEAREGDVLTAVVSRDRGRTKAQREFKIRRIMPDAAGLTPAAYITLPSLEQIETFKDGQAVPELGWPGGDNIIQPVAPVALVAMDRELDAVRESMLVQNTGFVSLIRHDPACGADGKSSGGAPSRLDLPFLPCSLVLYQISGVGAPAVPADFSSLADRVRGRADALVIPYNPFLTLEFAGRSFRILPLTPLQRPFPGDDTSCAGGLCSFTQKTPERVFAVAPEVAAAAGEGPVTVRAVYHEVNARGETTDRSVEFAARFTAKEGVGTGDALASLSLMGQLSAMQSRDLTDGETSGGVPAFTPQRRGYIGFRMYAASLNDVVALQEMLAGQGIKTVSRADRIAEVLSLDRYLGLLFWLIASASLAGAVCCLVANMYAGIERKRKELAILRLLGVHGSTLCIYPLCCSLLLTLGGIIISIAVFFLLAYVVNSAFASQLSEGERFCNLTMTHLLATVSIAVLIASVSGLAASRRVMKIEPSESLRDE